MWKLRPRIVKGLGQGHPVVVVELGPRALTPSAVLLVGTEGSEGVS